MGRQCKLENTPVFKISCRGIYCTTEHWLYCVCILTVSLFMKPQIPAATSQANKMTRQAKNCKTKQK